MGSHLRFFTYFLKAFIKLVSSFCFNKKLNVQKTEGEEAKEIVILNEYIVI